MSILKEIAFCSGEDAFLDIIGQAPNLREDGERDRFLELVEVWFEPGGTQRDCQRIIAEEHHRREEAKIMWHQASVASQQVCQPFGDTLLETEALESIGLLWAQAE